MADQLTAPRPEDVLSVGSRISWGAISAGAILALGIYSLLSVLGAAVGLSVTERLNPTTLRTSAVVWTLLTMAASLFVGGMVVSQFTVGETKTEAMLYGVIMWALLSGLLAALGAAGVRTGFQAMTGMANLAESASAQTWDKLAREAGIPAEQIEGWRRNLPSSGSDPQTQELTRDAARRLAWYAFAGTWISMFAATLGALVGAGPQFKVVALRPANRLVT